MVSLKLGGAFSDYGALDASSRVTLDTSGQLSEVKKPGNIFTRIISWATRSKAEKDANKACAKKFVDEIKSLYGDEIACTMEKDLSKQLNWGRPLTGSRIQRTMNSALHRIFTKQEIALAEKHGMSSELMMKYHKAQIPIHPRTIVSTSMKSDQVTKKERLSSCTSSVEKVTYGSDKVVVFKKCVEVLPGDRINGLSTAGTNSGITEKSAWMASRSIATKVVDEMLGFNLIPETQISELGSDLGLSQGLVSGSEFLKSREEVKGDYGKSLIRLARLGNEYLNDLQDMHFEFERDITGEIVKVYRKPALVELDMADGELRRQMVQLQLLDALCGQVDRHGGNFLVQEDDEGKLRLTGIDNDQAFGCNLKNGNSIGEDVPGYHGVFLPKIIDSKMKEAFDKITEKSLRDQLTGLLPAPDVEAAVKRLRHIKKCLNDPKRVTVIEPGEWESEKATTALENSSYSYVGRCRDALTTYSQLKVEFPKPRHRTEDMREEIDINQIDEEIRIEINE